LIAASISFLLALKESGRGVSHAVLTKWERLFIIFMSKEGDWVQQYGHMTIEQLKNANFGGQGQIRPKAPLWDEHIVERGHTILDALEQHPKTQEFCPELTISKTQYDILQRYHKR
jgi:nicotinamidase-related amidase